MSFYIDGFAFPIPTESLEAYKALAESVALIWKEHGALEYYEYSGDDMSVDGTLSFTDLFSSDAEETIVFGWVVFESREVRDLINNKVSNDPRMEELITSVDSGFDPQRMAYGGFKPLINLPDKSTE